MTVPSAEAAASVFVSYASSDAAVANAIVERLERQGLRCWIAPRDVVPGSLYADGIVRAINETRSLVLVLSEHALASKHVGKEVERASSKGHPIFAIRTDAVPLTPAFEYFLSESQWIDVGKGSIEAAVGKLVAAMCNQAPTHRVVSDSVPVLPKTRRWPVLGGIAALVALGSLLVAIWPIGKPAEQAAVASTPSSSVSDRTAISEKSIAVLPFTDMSEKKDQEYLADGMAEEILNLLAQAPDLLVSARTSSFYFKGKQTKIPDIARELGVAHILEGSVRKSGDHLRVTAQLVRAENGYHLWSETYDRDLHDVFKVQDDIANAVAQALQIKMTGGELSRRKGGTQNLEAYQLYLQAQHATDQHAKVSLDESDAYLQQAIQLDPSYGMALSLMSTNAITRTDSGFIPPKDGYEQGRAFAQNALQLSPDLARAHAGLQYVHRTLDWDWAAAEAAERRAVALDAHDPWPLVVGGAVAATLGRWDDAERKLRAALARDPLNTYALWNLALTYYNAGRYTDAETTIHRVINLAPDFLWAHAYLGKTYLAQGKPQAALEMVQEEADEWIRLWFLPIALRSVGRNQDADDALNALIAKTTPGSGPYFVSMNYAYRGETDLAFEWLERAYRERDFALVEIVGEVLFANIANDPRFEAFLIRMKLPTEWATRIAMTPSQSGGDEVRR